MRIAECCCGKTTLETEGEPRSNVICHCDNCKKRTGSAFGHAAYFKKEQVSNISGPLSCYELHHEEQNHDQQRYFCASCGTTLYWLVSDRPHVIGVAGGCFSQSPLLMPTISASESNRCSWLGEIDTFTKYE